MAPGNDHASMKKVPIVLVSYSHESIRHSKRVLEFANRLRTEASIESRLDRYEDEQVTNWPRWMRRQLRESDYVCMVFTRTYRRRFDGEETPGTGQGVTWEGGLITNMLYTAAGNVPAARRFIPVVLAEEDSVHVPRDVFSGTTFVLPDDWRRLVQFIRRVPTATAPPLKGAIPSVAEELRDNHPIFVARVLTRHKSAESRIGLSTLFVGAQRGTNLDLRGQLRKTRAAIESARFGVSIEFSSLFNVTLDRMLMEINRLQPEILHLSGKQDGGQIKLHDEQGKLAPISGDRLAELLADNTGRLRLVILDTCDSLSQARRIVKKVDFAIGVAAGIADPVAIDFFAMFYNAMANGASLKRAYDVAHGLEVAKIEGNPKYRRDIEEIIEADFVPDLHLPKLVSRTGLNPNRVALVL